MTTRTDQDRPIGGYGIAAIGIALMAAAVVAAVCSGAFGAEPDAGQPSATPAAPAAPAAYPEACRLLPRADQLRSRLDAERCIDALYTALRLARGERDVARTQFRACAKRAAK